MRFTVPEEGERRTIRRFLFIPKTIKDGPFRHETRWMEWATIVQEAEYNRDIFKDVTGWYWKDVCFYPDEPKEEDR